MFADLAVDNKNVMLLLCFALCTPHEKKSLAQLRERRCTIANEHVENMDIMVRWGDGN